jgi:hypothetical protein
MPEPYPYVHVEAEGSAGELHPSERRYLETEFKAATAPRPPTSRATTSATVGTIRPAI